MDMRSIYLRSYSIQSIRGRRITMHPLLYILLYMILLTLLLCIVDKSITSIKEKITYHWYGVILLIYVSIYLLFTYALNIADPYTSLKIVDHSLLQLYIGISVLPLFLAPVFKNTRLTTKVVNSLSLAGLLVSQAYLIAVNL